MSQLERASKADGMPGARLPPHRLRRTAAPVLCPITALAFYRYHKPGAAAETAAQWLVLAGEDAWLAVYGVDDADDDGGGGDDSGDARPLPASLSGRRCYGRLRVFAEQAIHGCRVSGGKEEGEADNEDEDVLVWGGRSVALVTRAHIVSLLEEAAHPTVDEVTAPDWIYDGLLPRGGRRASAGALVTAHNEVVPFCVGADSHGAAFLDLLGPPISPSRPMLYSAQLAWAASEGVDRLLVAAGTVFGEIVVWTCQLPVHRGESPATSSTVEILRVFEGHEGSIFDVAVSPELAVGAQRVRLLASCSDDRTIRIWPLYLDGAVGTASSETNGPRETGFQSTAAAAVPPTSSSSSSPPLAVAMAHASRIWHVRFGPVSPSAAEAGELLVYSFGEDATAQEWRLDLKTSPALSGALVHLRTLASHAGKNIWSAAVSPARPHCPLLVATGGCDGRVCLFQGQQGPHSSARPQAILLSSTVPARAGNAEDDGSNTRRVGQRASREEAFNSYAFLSDDQLLAATTHGRLLLGALGPAAGGGMATLTWTGVPCLPDAAVSSLQDYNVVRSLRGGGGGGGAAMAPHAEGLALIGNAAGQLFLFSAAAATAGLQPLTARLPGKVDDIFFLPPAANDDPLFAGLPSTLHFQALATTLLRGEAALLDVDVDTTNGVVLSERVCTLALPKRAPTSPAAVTITAASRCGEFIVLGSRTGQLCLYKPAIRGDPATTAYVLETQLQTRTRDAILAIVPLPPRTGQPRLSSSSFVVTARDGTYRIYTIEEQAVTTEQSLSGPPLTDPVRLRLQHETATPFGPIVRDAWFVPSTTGQGPPELVLCGFRSTDFVVWNETRQHELATVDCGGTHRAHTYLVCGGSERGRVRFAFTRHAGLHVFAQEACAAAPLQPGGHGREIRAISTSASGAYVATGGEDTAVRIWSNPSGPAGLAESPQSPPPAARRCLAVLKLHNTGLHSLVWLGDDCLISAAGSEELFVWRITTIGDSAYDGLAVLCAASYPDPTRDKVLRILGLDATADPDDPDAAFVSVGLSNSVLKTYRYARNGGREGVWQLLARGLYTGACPTQLRHLRPLRRGQPLEVLAAFADGHLTVWRACPREPEATTEEEAYEDYALLCATQVHRNAVKSLDIAQLASTTEPGMGSASAVFTGGDDNAVAVTRLLWGEGSAAAAFGKTFRVSKAHAAAVTGVRVLDETEAVSGSGSTFTAVSCSNDQRVKAWRVLLGAPDEEDETPAAVQLLDDQYSAVADPADVGRVGAETVVAVGMGMETWCLQ